MEIKAYDTQDIKDLYEEFKKIYAENIRYSLQTYSGMLYVLDKLKEHVAEEQIKL